MSGKQELPEAPPPAATACELPADVTSWCADPATLRCHQRRNPFPSGDADPGWGAAAGQWPAGDQAAPSPPARRRLRPESQPCCFRLGPASVLPVSVPQALSYGRILLWLWFSLSSRSPSLTGFFHSQPTKVRPDTEHEACHSQPVFCGTFFTPRCSALPLIASTRS